MPQQTAIEYLRTKLLQDSHLTVSEIFDIAREIEIKQVANAFFEGVKFAESQINKDQKTETEKLYLNYLHSQK